MSVTTSATTVAGAAPVVPEALALSTEFQQQAVRALTAHETALNQMKANLELDFLVYDEGLKQELVDTAADNTGNTPKRVAAFKVVVARLLADEIPGARRLEAETNENLVAALLRFKPKKDTPREGFPWVWTLAPGVGVTQNFREAVSDLAAHGGNERLKVRRPLQYWGLAVSALAQTVLGKDGKAKGKGKGGKDSKRERQERQSWQR